MHVSVVDFVDKFMGMASKALLMSKSIAMTSVLLCGALRLKPSSMSCVSCVSKVLVKCCGLKSCWVRNSGKCGAIRFSTSRSMTFKTVISSVMGLYEVTSVRSLLGLRIATIMPCFIVAKKM